MKQKKVLNRFVLFYCFPFPALAIAGGTVDVRLIEPPSSLAEGGWVSPIKPTAVPKGGNGSRG